MERLENGDVLGSAELLGECYSSEAEETLDILSEGDVDSTAIAAAHIRRMRIKTTLTIVEVSFLAEMKQK